LYTELRRKRMVPVTPKVRAKWHDGFGPLARHAGEQYF